jgi:Tfp pilus assembly protein PilF
MNQGSEPRRPATKGRPQSYSSAGPRQGGAPGHKPRRSQSVVGGGGNKRTPPSVKRPKPEAVDAAGTAPAEDLQLPAGSPAVESSPGGLSTEMPEIEWFGAGSGSPAAGAAAASTSFDSAAAAPADDPSQSQVSPITNRLLGRTPIAFTPTVLAKALAPPVVPEIEEPVTQQVEVPVVNSPAERLKPAGASGKRVTPAVSVPATSVRPASSAGAETGHSAPTSRALARSGQIKLALVLAILATVLAAAYFGRDPKAETVKVLKKGVEAYQAGSLDKARSLNLDVLASDPGNKVAYYNLGVLAQSGNRAAEAEDYYRRSLAGDPQFLPALFNLAILREAAGANAEAADLYKQIIARNPDHAASHFNLGLLLYAKLNDQAGGQAEIAKALKLEPTLAARLPSQISTKP